ncbi:phenylacetaldehyde reductase [Impatiens glandulifera]|uniref:phenylacetaldehyde reductase n=1 Tax=Impatiens glandulifera TaxID=253017 RepID=UPI001FB0A9A5|nr:phenylacetaldehyde reductase [Impatiens glandulifera]
MEINGNKNIKLPICVTGANGFIGTWLIHTLLEQGYELIHASIFPGSNASHLLSLPNASGRIFIHEADILDSTAVAKVIEQCSGGGVFHVASPCSLEEPTDPQRELLIPAVQGTLNILSAAKLFGVKRVVVTSSISALVPNPNWPKDKVFDESSWTDLDYCESRQKWYPISKTKAEKAAWEFAEKHELDMVTIHPSTCLGPLLQPGLNASSAVLQQLLLGTKDSQEYHWLGAVHVKDVAKAQLLLFETPSAQGRYLCTNGIYQFGHFAETVSRLFPEFPVHRFIGETQPGLVECKDAAKRLIDLGLIFTPIEDAVREAVESLKNNALL